MTRKATVFGLRIMALLACGALAAGCTPGGQPAPSWTAQQDPSTTDSPSPAAPAATAPEPGAGSASESPTPRPAATSTDWKTFADPAKTVSFELPQDWIAQSVAPEEGTLAGALKVEVKKPDGTVIASLRTGLPASTPECAEAARRPYTVISSLPVNLPALQGEGMISPHVVFRVIRGYRYFGSFGITNIVGGADGQACELRNVVRGPAGKGDYSFGDLPALKAFAPDEKVAPAKAFDTLDQAAKYVDENAEFANIQRMLMSLEIKN